MQSNLDSLPLCNGMFYLNVRTYIFICKFIFYVLFPLLCYLRIPKEQSQFLLIIPRLNIPFAQFCAQNSLIKNNESINPPHTGYSILYCVQTQQQVLQHFT